MYELVECGQRMSSAYYLGNAKLGFKKIWREIVCSQLPEPVQEPGVPRQLRGATAYAPDAEHHRRGRELLRGGAAKFDEPAEHSALLASTPRQHVQEHGPSPNARFFRKI